MPESGPPIRVYKENDMWHVDYGEGVIEDHTSEEEAMSAAEAVAEAEERTVVVEEIATSSPRERATWKAVRDTATGTAFATSGCAGLTQLPGDRGRDKATVQPRYLLFFLGSAFWIVESLEG